MTISPPFNLLLATSDETLKIINVYVFFTFYGSLTVCQEQATKQHHSLLPDCRKLARSSPKRADFIRERRGRKRQWPSRKPQIQLYNPKPGLCGDTVSVSEVVFCWFKGSKLNRTDFKIHFRGRGRHSVVSIKDDPSPHQQCSPSFELSVPYS